MAVWNPQSFDITKINSNTRYEDGNMPNAEAIDAAIEGAAFAQDKAEEAASSASSAESSASTAETAATNAQNSASAAQTAATRASQSASTAAENARVAANSAAQANAYASAARQSANTAAESAEAAEDTANNMMAFVTALTDPPDLSEVANIGTPSVSFVANGEYKKFKFSNLKGETGASVSDINFIYSSETSTETIYDVQTILADGTTVDSGKITIPKTTIPVISEFAEGEQTQPSADLMIGGFFFTEVQ